MKSVNVLLGVLAGVATGALVGILFAPHKGSKTRKIILNKGEDYADDLKEKMDNLLDTIAQKYQSIGQQADNLVDNVNDKYDEVKHDIKKSLA